MFSLPGHKYLVGGKKIENLFDITVHRVKENSHIPVIELNVFSLPGHKYLVGGKKIENLFDITVHRVKENSHIPVIELNVFSSLPGHKYLVLFVLLLYVPSQQLWSLRDGQFT